MVRNNGHATPAKALGFLRDNRRMNVLLSRAKWKLVMVGSLRFYENIVGLAQTFSEDEIGFLRKFLKALEATQKAGDASIIPWTKLNGETP
jgi:superfamily I DNA and/or RNA helicase